EEVVVDRVLEHDPIAASKSGSHRWDARWPDQSPEGITEALHTLGALEERLAEIDAPSLSPPWRVERRIVAAALLARIVALARVHPEAWDPVAVARTAADGLSSLIDAPSDRTPEARANAMLALRARLERLPAFLERAETNLAAPPLPRTQAAVIWVDRAKR